MTNKVIMCLFMFMLVTQIPQLIPAVSGQPVNTLVCYFHYNPVPQSVAGVSTTYTMDTTKDWSGNRSIDMISQIDFYLYPALASYLIVTDKITLHLWIKNEKEDVGDWYINATVNEQKSSGKTFVGNTLKQKTIRRGTQEFNVDIQVNHIFMENSSINVNIVLLTSNLEEPPPNTKVYLVYDSANEPTNVELRVENDIAIEWVKTFDENATERTLFSANWTEKIVWIQVDITDPLGGYDINPATVSATLIWPTGTINLPMTLKSGNLSSFSNIYHANWTYTDSSYSGSYDVVVTASDNSGNGVSAGPLSFRLAHEYNFEAQIVDAAGGILAGAKVTIANNNNVVYSGVSDNQGLINVTLFEDLYNIAVTWKQIIVNTTANYYLNSQSRISLMSKVYDFGIVAVDDTGSPLRNATVVVQYPSKTIESFLTDNQGMLTINQAPNGSYGIAVYWRDSRVAIVVEEVASSYNSTVTSDVYNLRVLVKNQFGSPIQDASVQLLLGNASSFMDETTDTNGLTVFEQILGGDYLIKVTSGQATVLQSINLEQSQVVEVPLTISTGEVPVSETTTAFPWEITIALILMIPAAALLVSYKRRKKKVKLVPHSFEFFYELTDGGIPAPSIVVLSGDPGSGGVLLCEELLYRDLQNNKPWIYVGFGDLPSGIRKRLQAFGHSTEPYEAKGKFIIIDCYSALAQVMKARKKERVVEDPLNLTSLSIKIMETVRNMPKGVRVLIDSTSPLFNKHEARLVVTFLHEIGARIKGHQGVFYYTVVDEGISKVALTRLEEMSDCVIETRVKETEGVWKRWLRVKKIIGRKIEDKPIEFEIDPKKGFIFYVKSRKNGIRNRLLRFVRKAQTNGQ